MSVPSTEKWSRLIWTPPITACFQPLDRAIGPEFLESDCLGADSAPILAREADLRGLSVKRAQLESPTIAIGRDCRRCWPCRSAPRRASGRCCGRKASSAAFAERRRARRLPGPRTSWRWPWRCASAAACRPACGDGSGCVCHGRRGTLRWPSSGRRCRPIDGQETIDPIPEGDAASRPWRDSRCGIAGIDQALAQPSTIVRGGVRGLLPADEAVPLVDGDV